MVFNVNNDRGWAGTRTVLYAFQLLGAPLICLGLGLVAGNVLTELAWVVLRGHDRGAETLAGYTAFSAVGFGLGFAVQAMLPRAAHYGGQWAWIVPCCLLVWGLLDQSKAPGTVIGTYFIRSPGDEGLGLALITWPALAACCYSAGVVAAKRRARTGLNKSP